MWTTVISFSFYEKSFEKSTTFGEIDVVREGYDRNVSNSDNSLLFSNWISFPIILLTILVRRARAISKS